MNSMILAFALQYLIVCKRLVAVEEGTTTRQTHRWEEGCSGQGRNKLRRCSCVGNRKLYESSYEPKWGNWVEAID